MITICTVIFGDMSEYLYVLTDSIRRKTKHVSEVIIVKVDESDGLIREWTNNNIRFRMLGYDLLKHTDGCPSPAWAYMVCGHAFGLHHAIDNAVTEYVWLTDPDVFFLDCIDETYLELMTKHQLHIVGVSHFNPNDQPYGYFPCVINCLTKKCSLPNSEWLNDCLFIRTSMRCKENPVPLASCKGKYLVPGPIPECLEQFVNPQGMFDVGCNLWLWNLEKQWKWMAFYLDGQDNRSQNNFGFSDLVYPMNYNLRYYKTNFGLTGSMGKRELLYHRTRGSHESGIPYRKIYDSLFRKRQSRPQHSRRGYIT